MGYLISIILAMVFMMIGLKMIFANIDGKRAIKQYNIRYFLQFTENFTYGRTNYIFFLALIIFIFNRTAPLFSMEGLVQFIVLLCVSIIIDILSQYAYHVYGRLKFKAQIKNALEVQQKIMEAKKVTDAYDDIIYPVERFDFKQVVESYLEEEQHLGIASMDGGVFANSISNLPPVTYVIDVFENKAKELLENKNIKVTTLTKDKGLPFKNEKIDTYVCNYTNFNKDDVLRILKTGGKLIITQRGSENLKELNTMYLPMMKATQWNRYICETILVQTGFELVEGQEQFGKIQFKSLEGVCTYLKETVPDYLNKLEIYINQFVYIDECIKQRGFFELTTHEFYIVCQKK